MSQTFLCLIRHIDYKNTKMQGIDQINKGLSFAIETREQITSKAQDIQTPLNINVIIRRKVESKREEEKRRDRKARHELSVKKHTQRKSPEFVMNSGLS